MKSSILVLAAILTLSAAAQSAPGKRGAAPAISPASPPTAPAVASGKGRTFIDETGGGGTLAAPDDLRAILDLTDKVQRSPQSAEVESRLRLVREAGFAIGLAKGFQHELNREIDRLHEIEPVLDSWLSFRDIFNMASRDIEVGPGLYWQPPVISEITDVIEISGDGRVLKTIDGNYRIISPDRFVAIPPRWQNYLMAPPPDVDTSLFNATLPRDASERRVWREAVTEGWQQGLYQAQDEIMLRVSRLRRDLIGMLTFVELQVKGQIRPGFIAAQRKDVVGGGNSMAVGSQMYQISNAATLNPDADHWRTFIAEGATSAYERQGIRVFKDHNRCTEEEPSRCP